MAELSVIKKLQSAAMRPDELEEIYRLHRDEYRVLLHLVQHPKFPQVLALGVISKLFAADLLRVIKNVKTNPYVRKKAELEFSQRCKRLALGEKLALMRTAPQAVLLNSGEESHPRLLRAILQNPKCSEEVVMRFIHRSGDRGTFYQALDESEWHRSPVVAAAIAHDPEAPIKILLKIIPHLGLAGLQEMFRAESTHQAVRDRIKIFLQERHGE
ncbi:MAG: hypothetical protein JXO51_05505 [Candidatus Aminicenantes bacterium]|nr:hypothetical protein [Candidatus Aminicenantes bacterium]